LPTEFVAFIVLWPKFAMNPTVDELVALPLRELPNPGVVLLVPKLAKLVVDSKLPAEGWLKVSPNALEEPLLFDIGVDPENVAIPPPPKMLLPLLLPRVVLPVADGSDDDDDDVEKDGAIKLKFVAAVELPK
jgi:hypothetical protein